MTKLSVNINKVATIRNARGGNTPDVLKFAQDCERFGAQGITVHPRPDERHIRYADALAIKPLIGVEYNIEGNPKGISKSRPYGFIDLVKEIQPAQVTLVPDAEGVLTSNAGWDTVRNQDYLKDVVKEFKACGIRVSIFIDANPQMIEMAAKTGTDRVELYTEAYASGYHRCVANTPPPLRGTPPMLGGEQENAYGCSPKIGELSEGLRGIIAPFVEAAKVARDCGLGLNAGHDLSLENLAYFHQQIPWCDEVSIGHALISDALYLGIEETIHRYLECLK
ncbi:MAG: pyridoxine 5'-phosphate synthase [Bacteroidales bacterium]|nr:pyridoxine 5'-phosphate synthase [Bacteroidales bacterium]